MRVYLNASPKGIDFPVNFAVTLYLLYDSSRQHYSLETEILPCDEEEDQVSQRWIIMHKLELEVRHGAYDLGKFLYVIKTYPVYRHLPTEAYERWISHYPERMPFPQQEFWAPLEKKPKVKELL